MPWRRSVVSADPDRRFPISELRRCRCRKADCSCPAPFSMERDPRPRLPLGVWPLTLSEVDDDAARVRVDPLHRTPLPVVVPEGLVDRVRLHIVHAQVLSWGVLERTSRSVPAVLHPQLGREELLCPRGWRSSRSRRRRLASSCLLANWFSRTGLFAVLATPSRQSRRARDRAMAPGSHPRAPELTVPRFNSTPRLVATTPTTKTKAQINRVFVGRTGLEPVTDGL